MKISTRGRYGLRALIELAREYGKGPVMMEIIASRQDLSRKYLHALLTRLKEGGLVVSTRGAKGGYALASPPGEIRLNDVVKSLEGSISVIDCVADENHCNKAQWCGARVIWVGLTKAIDGYLAGITLADLVTSVESMDSF